ncbi:uncharacterized protein [Bemisia tabaci]|uniref:uncharacterized protein n=1 Tax=Bemisia tabaci TaxID=7038 RepID=UPI003B27F1C2
MEMWGSARQRRAQKRTEEAMVSGWCWEWHTKDILGKETVKKVRMLYDLLQIQMEIYARSHGRDLGRLLKERGAGTDLKVDVAMTKEPTEIVREMDLERVRRLSHLLQIQMEIYASSHGRDLGRLLRERGAGTDLKVECYPSGKFNEVTENIRPRKEAVTVIIAGGNDVTVTKEPTEIIGEMNLERVRRLSERQNGGLVVWLELFHRHDKDAKFNAHVRAVNKRIHKKLTRSKEDEKRIAVIQTSGLKRDDFNKGGLHLINQRKQSIFSTSINVFMFRNKISVHFFPSLKFIYRHRPLHSC